MNDLFIINIIEKVHLYDCRLIKAGISVLSKDLIEYAAVNALSGAAITTFQSCFTSVVEEDRFCWEQFDPTVNLFKPINEVGLSFLEFSQHAKQGYFCPNRLYRQQNQVVDPGMDECISKDTVIPVGVPFNQGPAEDYIIYQYWAIFIGWNLAKSYYQKLLAIDDELFDPDASKKDEYKNIAQKIKTNLLNDDSLWSPVAVHLAIIIVKAFKNQ